jgi:hypothetical protein
MLSATFIDLVFIPLFYVLVNRLFKKRHRQITADNADPMGPQGRR